MFFRPFGVGVCLMVCLGCVLGLYRLGAQTPTPASLRPQPTDVTETQSVGHRSGTWQNEANSDFYQTIIDNNLFAPLGTDLHPKPVPGADLTLIATFVRPDALRSTVLINNGATHSVVSIGSVLGEFTVMKIQPKQVTLDHHGKRPVVLHLPETVFLNTQRR